MKTLRRVGLSLLAVVCVLSTAAAVTFGLLWRNVKADLDAYAASEEMYDREKVAQGLHILQKNALFPAPSRDGLTDELLRALVSAWGDPYAAYFDAAGYDAYLSGLAGSLCGVGVVVKRADEGLLVLDVFPDSPAGAAGLVPGDVILRVDGQTMDALGYDAFLDAIRGEAGTTVSLVWLTPADPEPRTADVVRARVDKRTVLLRDLPGEDRVGYLRITGFDGLTYAAFKASLDELIAEGKEAVVFDLRGNGGGTLDSVCRILSYLLPDGDIVTVDYAAPDAQDYTIRAEGETYHSGGRSERFPDAAHALTLPVAVLCDAGTASAAELFCAALRDYTAAGAFDAVIVGAPTYGKGTVQTSHLLPDGSAVKLTVATYAPPSGVCYDGVGILPDRPVEADPTAPDLYLRDLSLDPQCAAAVAALCAKID